MKIVFTDVRMWIDDWEFDSVTLHSVNGLTLKSGLDVNYLLNVLPETYNGSKDTRKEAIFAVYYDKVLGGSDNSRSFYSWYRSEDLTEDYVLYTLCRLFDIKIVFEEG